MHIYLSCLECHTTTVHLCSSSCMTVRRRGLRCRSHILMPSFSAGRTDLKSFVAPYIKSGQLLHAAAVATRVVSPVAYHQRESIQLILDPRPSIYACVVLCYLIRVLPCRNIVQAGLSMLANTGRWPAIYGQLDYPSLAMLSSIRVDNRGNVVLGANIASVRRGINHRGPLVCLCHEVGLILWLPHARTPTNLLCDTEVFGGRYPGSTLAIGEEGLSLLNRVYSSCRRIYFSRPDQARLPTSQSDCWINLA